MIIVIGNNKRSSTGDISEEKEICKAFGECGYDSYFVDRDKYKKRMEELTECDEDIEFIFIAKNNVMHDLDISYLKETYNCPILYWMSDYIEIEKHPDFQRIAKECDLWIGRQFCGDDWFGDNDVKYLYWNFDVACNIYKKEEDKRIFVRHPQTKFPQSVPVNFIGNWVHNPRRMKFLHRVQQEIFDLHITTLTIKEYEDGKIDGRPSEYKLNNLHNPLYGSDFNKLVGITKINLSIDWIYSPGFWSPRTARLMAAGGFVMVKYVYGMEKIFGKDKENLVYFNTADECVSAIKYYLKHPKERMAIQKRGYEFVKQHLRPKHRVKELTDYIYENLLNS